MKKFVLTVAVLLVAATLVTAQEINDSFSSMGDWRPGYGDWSIESGRLVQGDATNKLARIDRRAVQDGVYEIEFTIRYLDGGYENDAALSRGELHGGFGIHLGVEKPAFGRKAWGAGESYLLWLNLDTRKETRRENPEHYGFRAQVYESVDNSTMALGRHPLIPQVPAIRRIAVDDYASIDIVAALRNMGKDVSLGDLRRAIGVDVPINIRVDMRKGEIGVLDPTAPVRFWFPVDPAVLEGDYVCLRTNDFSASFNYFQMD